MKVYFTNAYSMSEVRRLCERGQYPRQHLWGADALARAGHDVEWGPFGGDERLTRLTRLTRGKLGALQEEVALARMAGRDALVYSGDQNLTRGLAWLRRFRLASVFHSIGPPRVATGWVRRVDVAVCLSERTRDVLVHDYGRDPGSTPVVRWGPDLNYRGYGGGSFDAVVSSGKTDRDFGLLRAALDRCGLPARVHEPRDERIRDLNEILADVRCASVVAIPLLDPDKLLGLSEFNDAIACGKPVVMTRSPHFDFDIEAEGFGIWVDCGDVDGFAAALTRAAADAEAMGAKARAFAEAKWNYEAFCAEVTEALSPDPPIRWVK